MTKPIVRNESFTDNSLQLEGIRMKGFACVSRHMWGWSVPFSGRVSRPPAPWTLVNLLHPDWFGSLEQCSRNNKSMPLAHEASEVAALSQGEIWPLSRKANQSLKVPCFHAIFYLCPVISWTPGRVAFFFSLSFISYFPSIYRDGHLPLTWLFPSRKILSTERKYFIVNCCPRPNTTTSDFFLKAMVSNGYQATTPPPFNPTDKNSFSESS